MSDRRWRRAKPHGKLLAAALGLGMGVVGREVLLRRREADLRGRVAVITGASRGLGFLLARELTREGCNVVICARDEAELEYARQQLAASGAQVLAVPCDVSNRDQVERLASRATAHFGQVDILINNAGIAQVGPLAAMELADFEQALGVMFWGVVYPTLAVLPQMRRRQGGRIVNITSVGGKIGVPHLLPYTCAKFAAVGFSEGLRAELAAEGITVTTIVPGLMRTGSPVNAEFKGEQHREYIWFGLGASMPGLSMDAERAARQIVRSLKRGEAERVLTIPATLATRFHGLFPGVTADILGLVNRLLPSGGDTGRGARQGLELHEEIQNRWLNMAMAWGRSAGQRFNEYPAATPREPRNGPRAGGEQ